MRSEKGFTLVEVILAIGIFAIVAVPIVSMFLDGIKITSKSENTSEAYAYAQQCVEKLKGGVIKLNEVAKDTPISIDDTEYTYSIKVNSMRTEEQINEEKKVDGEDFYKYMNETDSYKMTMPDNATISIDSEGKINGIATGKDKIWLQYGDLDNEETIEVENNSGSQVDIYLHWTGEDTETKNNLKIKNKVGKIAVYGPVDKSIEEIGAENRGRKQTANVTVIVENSRTGEHAELTANVTHYE